MNRHEWILIIRLTAKVKVEVKGLLQSLALLRNDLFYRNLHVLERAVVNENTLLERL